MTMSDVWMDVPDDVSYASSLPWETVDVTVVMPAWTRGEGVCPAFRWIGQPFMSCDRCGQPYWDHTHEERLADSSDPFSDNVRHEYLSQERRDAVRAKWDRSKR